MNEMLERKFVYQNGSTGKVSSAPLTTRQLVLLLCPIHASSVTVLTPETLVLGISKDHQYDQSGWKACKNVPVLQQACAVWYYLLDSTEQEQQGPVSCRQVFDLLANQTITKHTRVWSSHLTEWKSISDLPELCVALDAFETTQMMVPPTLNTTDTNNNNNNDNNTDEDKHVQEELEAFLSSTAHLGPQQHAQQDDDEGYISDGGTSYVKDTHTGNWVHADLAKKNDTNNNNNNHNTKKRPQSQQTLTTKKKKTKPKFSQKHAKCWIYLQGLPTDTTTEELHAFCSKTGIIELYPETQLPKIKLYRDDNGNAKGDASVCYARPESVDLALQLLDEAPFRPNTSVTDFKVKVSRAKFEQHGTTYEKKQISNAKRKVAKLAALQAIGWDEGENGRLTGGIKGLRIIVLKHLFTPLELSSGEEDVILQQVEHDVYHKCQEWGTVEKMTIFSKHVDGVVIVKFKEPTAASTAVQEYNGKLHESGRKLECTFWDGVTDYTVPRNEEEEQKEATQRQEAFGEWLDNQDVPQEFQLLTES